MKVIHPRKSHPCNILTLQGGTSSLSFNGTLSEYAVFGPYPNICITAPHTCTEGFTIGLWIKRMVECNLYGSTIFSTHGLGPPTKEGIDLRCDTNTGSNKMHVLLTVSLPSAKSEPFVIFATARDAWFHCTLVWTASSDLVIYENGGHLKTEALALTGDYAENVESLIVFGRRYTDDQEGTSDYGTGFVDGVKIYNRPLNATEVMALYYSKENEY